MGESSKKGRCRRSHLNGSGPLVASRPNGQTSCVPYYSTIIIGVCVYCMCAYMWVVQEDVNNSQNADEVAEGSSSKEVM